MFIELTRAKDKMLVNIANILTVETTWDNRTVIYITNNSFTVDESYSEVVAKLNIYIPNIKEING